MFYPMRRRDANHTVQTFLTPMAQEGIPIKYRSHFSMYFVFLNGKKWNHQSYLKWWEESQQYSCQNTRYPSRARRVFHSLAKANVIRFEDFPGGSTVFHYSPTISLTKICLRIVPSRGSLPSQRQISLQATNRTARKQCRHSKVSFSLLLYFFYRKSGPAISERLFGILNHKREKSESFRSQSNPNLSRDA